MADDKTADQKTTADAAAPEPVSEQPSSSKNAGNECEDTVKGEEGGEGEVAKGGEADQTQVATGEKID